jgi:hypothetical protein
MIVEKLLDCSESEIRRNIFKGKFAVSFKNSEEVVQFIKFLEIHNINVDSRKNLQIRSHCVIIENNCLKILKFQDCIQNDITIIPYNTLKIALGEILDCVDKISKLIKLKNELSNSISKILNSFDTTKCIKCKYCPFLLNDGKCLISILQSIL